MAFLSTRRQRRSTGPATVVLAILLLLQSSTLYFQHHHPGSSTCEENRLAGLAAGPHEGTFPSNTIIESLDRFAHGLPSKATVCVICFFNQNYFGFTTTYVVPDGSQTPSLTDTSVREDFFLPDDLFGPTSPRAPPLCV